MYTGMIFIKNDSPDSLSHHGILGMKWGVRRYQNKDGTLTPAGKKREAKLRKELGNLNAPRTAQEFKRAAARKRAESEYLDAKNSAERAKLRDEYERSSIATQKKKDEVDAKNYERQQQLNIKKTEAELKARELQNKENSQSWVTKTAKTAISNLVTSAASQAGKKVMDAWFGSDKKPKKKKTDDKPDDKSDDEDGDAKKKTKNNQADKYVDDIEDEGSSYWYSILLDED
jgi:hypothetical protein